jgi:SHS2 domain-containing protein
MPGPRQGHELIEHTADVGLRVWAPTVCGLFAEAAVALIDVMGSSHGPPRSREDVRLEAPDREALFVDWLSEVLFLFDARGFVTQGAEVRIDEDRWGLAATLDGTDVETFRQHGPAVKAVTYHGLEIREKDAGYEARVYLDV